MFVSRREWGLAVPCVVLERGWARFPPLPPPADTRRVTWSSSLTRLLADNPPQGQASHAPPADTPGSHVTPLAPPRPCDFGHYHWGSSASPTISLSVCWRWGRWRRYRMEHEKLCSHQKAGCVMTLCFPGALFMWCLGSRKSSNFTTACFDWPPCIIGSKDTVSDCS